VRIARRDSYGPPEVVRIEEVERPTPSGDQVLVRVVAASVNRADLDGLRPRWQFTRLFLGLRKPRLRELGIDVAGTVEVVGPNVTRFKPGDQVFADLFAYGSGAFAEYVCAPEKAFLPIPMGLTHEEAATLPHSAVLALQGLRLRNRRTPQPGDEVLVVGASGNVGPFAVQIAKSLGARVTAVASGDKIDFVRSLGADEVIDYRTTDYTRTGRKFDWIVDVDAHHSFLRWPRSLRRGGAYVAMGGSASWILQALLVAPLLSLASGRKLALLLWWKPFDPADIERVGQLVREGKVTPAIDRTYPLSEIAEALRRVDDGHARGKVLVVP
jgi:NADPH:quinone reductase-like Zn-dependent oxidoreductase